MKAVECKIRVRYSEVGRQGFAHHAHYLNWFDNGLEEIIHQCGLSYKDIEEQGFFLAPVSDTCKYHHPAYYNDVLTVRVGVAELSSVKISFSYEIFREKDTVLIARGRTEHVFVDRNFKPYSLKRVLPKLYETLEGMV